MRIQQLPILFALAAVPYGCGDDGGSDRCPTDDAGEHDASAVADSGLVTDSGKGPQDSGGAPGSDAGVDAGAPDSAVGQMDGAVDGSAGSNKDAGPDSSIDAGAADSGMADSGPMVDMNPDSGPTTSAACTACLAASCSDLPDFGDLTYAKACDIFGTDLASNGPSKGQLKRTLCNDVIACALRTRCAENEGLECICGDGVPYNDCYDMEANAIQGPCRDAIYRGAETVDLKLVLEGYTDPTLGAGRALYALKCATAFCSDECYGYCKDKPDGTACNQQDEYVARVMGETGSCWNASCIDTPSDFGK